MATNHDWLNHNHQGLYNQANQTNTYIKVAGNKTRMGLNGSIDLWINNEFDPKFEELSKAFLEWLDPSVRTPMKVSDLEDAEKAFIPFYRQLYTGMIRNNPLVTDADLVAMGLPKRPDGHREPVPAPTGLLEVTTTTPSPGVVKFYFKIFGEKKSKKPYGVQGYELRGGFFEEPPVNWSQLPGSYFTTTSPLHLNFEGDQRGKTFYFAARMENNRGVKGDWTKILAVIVP